MGKRAVDPDFRRNTPNARNRGDEAVPIDVHQDVFDAQADNDLIPMEVDEIGGNEERKKERQPMPRRINGTAREADQVRPGTENVAGLVVSEVMRTPLTINLETLVGTSPVVKRGLVSAV